MQKKYSLIFLIWSTQICENMHGKVVFYLAVSRIPSVPIASRHYGIHRLLSETSLNSFLWVFLLLFQSKGLLCLGHFLCCSAAGCQFNNLQDREASFLKGPKLSQSAPESQSISILGDFFVCFPSGFLLLIDSHSSNFSLRYLFLL